MILSFQIIYTIPDPLAFSCYRSFILSLWSSCILLFQIIYTVAVILLVQIISVIAVILVHSPVTDQSTNRGSNTRVKPSYHCE